MMADSGTRRFDVVVLGGGSAGCVLAARLSEDAGTSVLLAEAGPDVRPGAVPEAISSPYPGKAYFNPDWTWPTLRVAFGSDLSNSADRTVRPYEQARVLGGGSSINGIGANRGAPSDFDEWDAMGAAGWNWSGVLPYFRKLERDLDYGSDGGLHNGSGPLPIRRIPRALYAGFIRDVEAELASRGHVRRDDQNGPWEDGLFPISTNLDENGRRASAATAYLTQAVRRRPNLTVWAETRAERVVMDGHRATGAVLRRAAGSVQVEAGLVVVSAGALHSPALLLRSGIGAPAALATLGIAVAVRRDGVGRNLQEHPSIGLSAFMPRASRPPHGDHYHLQGILRWSSGLEGAPQGDMHLAMNMRSGWHAVGSRLGLLFNWVNKSYSQGSVTLASADPGLEPDVDFRLLSDRRDLLRLADAFRLAASTLLAMRARGECLDVFPSTYSAKVKKWLAPSLRNGAVMSLVGPAMDAVPGVRHAVLRSVQEGMPPLEELLRNEAELHAFLRRNVGGVWHPSGTCRLGATDDPAAVCDPEGRVIGAEGLIVCDASVMPSIPCANLNIPVLMIAEKIADGIRARRRRTNRIGAEQ